MPGGLDVADVDDAGERGCPETRDRAAAGVERQMIAGALVEPARRHDPGVFLFEVALLRPGEGALIPRMALIDRIAQRILLDERLGVLPVVVVGTAQQDADVEVDVNQVGGDQLPSTTTPGVTYIARPQSVIFS